MLRNGMIRRYRPAAMESARDEVAQNRPATHKMMLWAKASFQTFPIYISWVAWPTNRNIQYDANGFLFFRNH